MSAAKHTPGPWTLSDNAIYGNYGVVKPLVAYMDDRFNDDEAKANARLVSAAPELLDCLIDLLDADGDLYAMDFNRYRAAVAAATGGDL